MTTRKFSATDLPHPRYSLEIGRFTLKSTIGNSQQQKQQQQQQRRKQQQFQEQKLDNAKQSNDNNTRTTKKRKTDGGENDEGDDDDVNLPPTCLPRFSQLAQVIEVKLPGFTLPNRVGSNIKDFLGSYCVIENARPELFIRRDFISKFVDKGTIHVAQLSDHRLERTTCDRATTSDSGAAAAAFTGNTTNAISPYASKCGYKLSTTRDNVLIITMNSKQYHRFGMLATRVISPMQQSHNNRKQSKLRHGGAPDKCYRVEINLNDKRIMTNNKYQDKLMQTLRRLIPPINKIYFRFIPDKSKLHLSPFAAHEYSLEFFSGVIDEYKLDGCQPVPLTKCSIALHRVQRNWINRSQLHPSLELSRLLEANRGDTVLFRSQLDQGRDDDKLEVMLNGIIDIIDWHGYQLLALDCNKLAKMNCWSSDADSAIASSSSASSSRWTKGPSKRYDVSCTRLVGAIDYQHVQSNLHKLFTYDTKDDVVFRAMFLYDAKDDKQLLLSCATPGDDTKNSNPMDVSDGGDSHDANREQTTTASSINHFDDIQLPAGTSLGASGGCGGPNSGVVYLQDCSNGPKAAREITVIGLSELVS